MLDAAAAKHAGEQFGFVDRNRTHQNRLAFFVAFCDLVNDRIEFCFLSFLNNVVVIVPLNRTVGRDLNDVQLVNFPELTFLS